MFYNLELIASIQNEPDTILTQSLKQKKNSCKLTFTWKQKKFKHHSLFQFGMKCSESLGLNTSLKMIVVLQILKIRMLHSVNN